MAAAAGISPASTFVSTTTFRIPYKLRPLSYSVSFFLRTAYDVYVLPPLLLLLLSLVTVFQKSVSRRAQIINNHYVFGRLSRPDHPHNNPGYLCPTLNTLYQVTPRE